MNQPQINLISKKGLTLESVPISQKNLWTVNFWDLEHKRDFKLRERAQCFFFTTYLLTTHKRVVGRQVVKLALTYFPTYLPIYGTYLLHNWLPRWNQILTQLRFIHNWVMMGIQWMVQWWVLVHCGQVIKRSVSIDTKYLTSSFLGRGRQANLIGPLFPQKMKLWRLLKIEGSVLMYIVPPFSPTHR
jgi:hypothetical protein